MSIKVLSSAWDASSQDGGTLVVLLALCDYADDETHTAWPTIPKLALKSRLSDRQTQRALSHLEDAGEIRRVRSGGGRGNAPAWQILVGQPHVLKGDIDVTVSQNGKGDISGRERVTSVVERVTSRGGDYRGGELDPSQEPLVEPSIPPISPKGEYTQEFQAWWKDYPPVTNNSKLKAWKAWQKLSQEEQGQAKQAIPAFTKSEGWRTGFAPHASTFLNGKLWEDIPAATPLRSSSNGHANGRGDVDKRPAIKPAEFGPAKRMSDEKKAEILRMRREFEA